MTLGSVDLEDFDCDSEDLMGAMMPMEHEAQSDPAEEEAKRLAVYEEGYRSGWDDAVRAAEGEERAIGAELARNLKDLSFTYFEARDEVLASVRSFLAELLDRMFPALLPEAVAANVAQEMAGIVEDLCDGRFTIVIAPDDAATVKRLLSSDDHRTVTVVSEPAMATGQARIRSAKGEASIDAGRLVATLKAAVGHVQIEEDRAVG